VIWLEDEQSIPDVDEAQLTSVKRECGQGKVIIRQNLTRG